MDEVAYVSENADLAKPITSGAPVDLSCVRPLERSDIPQICDLFCRTFRPGRVVRREAIEACLAQTYLTAPQDRVRPASLVDVSSSGRVAGFMGIITLSACYGARQLRCGMLGNFMATEADRQRSGARLARASATTDLDFVFTDTANRTSLDLSRAMKYELLPLESLEWIKVLRPAETASFLLSRRWPALRAALAPLARVADRAARRLAFAALPNPGSAGILDRPMAPKNFVERAPAFVSRFALRPDWRAEELAWLLDQASQKTRNGRLQIREVIDRNDKCLGLYLFYCRAGAVAQVLQFLPRQGREAIVLESLFRHAADSGAVAVRGNAGPIIASGLIRHAGIFYHHVAASVVFTKQPDLREAFRCGEILLGGLMGESWTRLVADEFA